MEVPVHGGESTLHNGAMSNEGSTAALYIRVSTRPQEGGESLAVQEAQLRAMAKARGMTVMEPPFRDVASGADRDRPGLAAAAARAGEYDSLLVFDVTRFGRSAGDSLTLVRDRIHPAGSDVLDLQGRSSTDKVVFGMLSVLAEYERDSIADRTSSARRAMASRGEWATGLAPYGTRVPDEGPRLLEVNEDEAAWIREAADRVLAGETTGAVAAWLNAAGAPSPSRGRVRWKYSSVSKLLRSERLWSGRAGWRGMEVPHPRILDEATGLALRKELDSRGNGGNRAPARYPLTGHVVCTCGGLWRSWGKYNSKDPDARHYGCGQRDRLASSCDWTGITAAEAGRLEAVVWSALLSLVDIGAFESRFAEPEAGGPEGLSGARSTVGRLERELSALYRREASGDAKAVGGAIREAEADLTAARREEARLAAAIVDREAASRAIGAARSALDRVWATSDPEEMAAVLRDLRVVVRLQQPVGDEDLAWVIEAELLAEPAERVGVRASDIPFEKEVAALESSE